MCENKTSDGPKFSDATEKANEGDNENEVHAEFTFDLTVISDRFRRMIDETIDAEIKGIVFILKETVYKRSLQRMLKELQDE